MSEKPILFSTPMVKAILEGRKSQTRRVVKLPPAPMHLGQWEPMNFDTRGCYLDRAHTKPAPEKDMLLLSHTRTGQTVCPKLEAGDLLWVKETWRLSHHENGDDCPCYKADNICQCGKPSRISIAEAKWKSGRFMFKKYTRLWLEVTEVRVQRLQEISPYDALCEGVQLPMPRGCEPPIPDEFPNWSEKKREEWIKGAARVTYFARCADADNHVTSYRTLWDSLNGKTHPWESNPWVWAYTFKRLDRREQEVR